MSPISYDPRAQATRERQALRTRAHVHKDALCLTLIPVLVFGITFAIIFALLGG
jgi:hypothetical protein